MIELPKVHERGETTVEQAMQRRRSVREYADRPLSLAEISQLVWAAQGITNRAGDRTVPSAGALYPLELLVAAGAVSNLPAGVYRYLPRRHGLADHLSGDVRNQLARASINQTWMQAAPVNLILAGVYERTRREYGDWAERYVHMEVGHAAQNVHLQAVGLGLGAVVVGAFDEQRVGEILELAPEETPLLIMPVGRLT